MGAIQASLFRYSNRSLAVGQYRQAGAIFINEGKNILVIFLVAKAVISGQLTLGAMMAVQYILGQPNDPVEQLLGFIQGWQDARISMERLNGGIHGMQDEEPQGKAFLQELPASKTIQLQNLSFQYPGVGNEPVLKDIGPIIPNGKTTAIVGMSGCGKTTLLNLLSGFYAPQEGKIKVGNTPLSTIKPHYGRQSGGVVMQEDFIFSDTTANNPAVNNDHLAIRLGDLIYLDGK